MSITFAELPRAEKVYILSVFGLPSMEERLLFLRYVECSSYDRIAAELNISPKSVGTMLTRARRHAKLIANELYAIADDRCREIIDRLGWVK